MSVYKSLPEKTPFIAYPTASHAPSARRRTLFFALFAFFFAATLSYFITKNPTATTATVVGFNPGNIINDYTMSNYTTMTESEIQAWLTAKNSCKNNDYGKYQYLIQRYNKDLGKPESTHSWHWTGDAKTGHFVCLSEERFGEGTAIGVENGETAAHIIAEAAKDYKINPQVLLVLLEKEQGLISDTIPRSGQYRSATGFGCPDTAACDSKYYGFKNQVRNAAALFRLALDGKSSYYPIGNNYVQYNPEKSCGGSWVNIENRATGVLYRYTPYQPNAAALAAGTGKGDTCSAYGNRNFYHYFTSWFGSTQTKDQTANSSTLGNGVYQIVPEYNSSLALSRAADDTNIAMRTKNFMREPQQWRLTYNADLGAYSIADLNGKVLSIDNAAKGISAEAKLRAADANACGQYWRITKTNYGTYTFTSVCNAKLALDIYTSTTNLNSYALAYNINGTAAQRWHLLEIGAETVGAKDGITDGGTYEIYSALNQNYVIDVGDVKDGTNVQIYRSDHSIGQKWKFTKNSDGTYSIANIASGKLFEIASSAAKSEANVQLYKQTSSCGQKWRVLPNSDGTVTLSSACNDRLSADAKGGAGNGNNIWVFNDNGTKAQRWVIKAATTTTTSATSATPTTTPSTTTPSTTTSNTATTTTPSTTTTADLIDTAATYAILTNFNTKFAVDISTTANGANVQLYSADFSIGQKWKFTKNSDGTYTISHAGSGKVIEVASSSTKSEANVQINSANNSCGQKWHLTKNADSTYTFTSACNNKLAMDAKGGAKNGNNIWIFTSNGTAAQRWVLKKL